jgi:hypothetical protein
VRAAFVLFLVAAPALAQENTPELCRDGIDNDGDGWIDCADAECQQLPQCARVYPQQPVYPRMYPPPPPQMYPPPPPAMTYPVPAPEPHYGLPTGISGAVLLVAGVGMLAGSAGPWIQANCHSGDPILLTGSGCSDDGARDVGIVLSVLGSTALLTGVIMTPLGFSQYANWRRWKAGRVNMTGRGLRVTF